MWTQFLDGIGYNIKQDADKSVLLAELHRRYSITVPVAKSLHTTRYSRSKHRQQELWRHEWIAHWSVPDATPCYLWLMQRTFDSATTTTRRDGCCCLLIDKHKRDSSYAYPRMVYVHLECDHSLFAGTLLDGELVYCQSTKTHAFLADDLIVDRGIQLALLPPERRQVSLGERLMRLQTIVDSEIIAHPATDVCAVRVKPMFTTNRIVNSANELLNGTRLDYGSNPGASPSEGIVPNGIIVRSLKDAGNDRIVFRVHRKFQTKTEENPRDDSGNDSDYEWSESGSDEDDNNETTTASFYVRSTHISDVFELFESLSDMDATPVNSGRAPLAAVPSMDDADALKKAADSRQSTEFASNPRRLNGKWCILNGSPSPV